MTYQMEAALEEQFVEQLVKEGYEKVKINNENDLINNFRVQVNKLNEHKLNCIPLNDEEFERLLVNINVGKIFECSKKLRTSHVIERSDGTTVYLKLFDEKNHHNNIFQVANQITIKGEYEHRYDVTILINGLPLVQIELKRRGSDLKQAFNQIMRYKKESYKGLFSYVQCFVISNGVDTKYFANTTVYDNKSFSFDFTFFWSDDKNNRISNLSEFTSSFLNKYRLNNLIAKYTILMESNQSLMIMRPYQIYAVEALLKRATETNNNGYIWHTTGSGKTLTSFKASQLLSNEDKIKKVFFLIDRKDLDGQTVEEFNKFEKDSVDTTENVEVLVKQLSNVYSRLIVTTIQKLFRLLDSKKYSDVVEKFKNEKVIFIIDECHRTQFGNMHTEIKRHFKNAQYFGFTGTPRLTENKSQDGRTTNDIFEKELHHYLIKDAINDGNVLGFSVDYINTIKSNLNENSDEQVKGINTKEVLQNPIRLEIIAKKILEIHNNKTSDKNFCALFAVESIPMLIKYYETFKKLNHNLKITAMYSFQDNDDNAGKDENPKYFLENIINDYKKMFNLPKSSFGIDNVQKFFKDVSNKLKDRAVELDIVIVVNMLLTGFDSKYLNTLYIDKNLEYHNLLQAYSRTNRILDGTKPYGNIVCFRNLKENTDNAICLFSNSATTDVVLMHDYEYYLKLFRENLQILYSITPTVGSVDSIQDENIKLEFVEAFKNITKQLFKLKTFKEFEFNKETIGIDKQEYQDYKSKYLDIYDTVIKNKSNDKVSILNDIDFAIELVESDKINVSYIINLLTKLDYNSKDKLKIEIEKIKRLLDNTDNRNLRLKSDLIKEFLDKFIYEIPNKDEFTSSFYNFLDNKENEEIEELSKEVNVSPKDIQNFLNEYKHYNVINREEVRELFKSASLSNKRKFTDRVEEFIKYIVNKFTFN